MPFFGMREVCRLKRNQHVYGFDGTASLEMQNSRWPLLLRERIVSVNRFQRFDWLVTAQEMMPPPVSAQ